MAKGHNIGEAERQYIVSTWREMRKESQGSEVLAKDVLKAVEEHLNEKYGYSPKIRAVQDILTKAKLKDKELLELPLDKPWHLGAFENDKIPADAIPYLLAIQYYINEYHINELLTSRQASWVGRLYILCPPMNQLKEGIAFSLYQWAKAYAKREIICYLTGTDFNTLELDKGLRDKSLPPVIEGNSIATFNWREGIKIDTADK